VDSGRHVGERVGENESSLQDVLRRDAVGDVDHLDVRRDALDDAAARADEVVLESEVGQEGEEPARDAASLTARTRPEAMTTRSPSGTVSGLSPTVL
jgi:hypothetical protein